MTVVSRAILFSTRFCQTSQAVGFPPHLPPHLSHHIAPSDQVSLRHASHWRRWCGTTHFSAGQRVFGLLGRDRDFRTSAAKAWKAWDGSCWQTPEPVLCCNSSTRRISMLTNQYETPIADGSIMFLWCSIHKYI